VQPPNGSQQPRNIKESEGAFGRASPGSAPRTKPEALPNGLVKQLPWRSSSGTPTLEQLGRGELQKPAPPRLSRLLPTFCQPCPQWGPSGHDGCRGAGGRLAVVARRTVARLGRGGGWAGGEGAAAEVVARRSRPGQRRPRRAGWGGGRRRQHVLLEADGGGRRGGATVLQLLAAVAGPSLRRAGFAVLADRFPGRRMELPRTASGTTRGPADGGKSAGGRHPAGEGEAANGLVDEHPVDEERGRGWGWGEWIRCGWRWR
jgi:hypothetical protein